MPPGPSRSIRSTRPSQSSLFPSGTDGSCSSWEHRGGAMNRSQFLAALLLSSAALALPIGQACAQAHEPSREDARLITATQVLEELRRTPDQNVPAWLLQRAYGVAVIPEVIKGAFVFGGRFGSGVLTVRDTAGHFSNPIFIKLA